MTPSMKFCLSPIVDDDQSVKSSVYYEYQRVFSFSIKLVLSWNGSQALYILWKLLFCVISYSRNRKSKRIPPLGNVYAHIKKNKKLFAWSVETRVKGNIQWYISCTIINMVPIIWSGTFVWKKKQKKTELKLMRFF